MQGLIIADAGGTKTDWTLIIKGSDEIIRVSGVGINPLITTDEHLQKSFKKVADFFPAEVSVIGIKYFGAGCIGKEINEKLKRQLLDKWPFADIMVESDLLGAAIALFGTGTGIVSILGTGSNSCFYREGVIEDQIPPLGYILGDEGSGNALGKRLLNAFFKRDLPKDILEKFRNEYNLNLPTLIEKIYRGSRPAAFIASFTPFLIANLNHRYIYNLVWDELQEFFIRNICKYTEARDFSVGFIGSVALEFKDIILKICESLNITPGVFLRSPMEGLISYYKSNF